MEYKEQGELTIPSAGNLAPQSVRRATFEGRRFGNGPIFSQRDCAKVGARVRRETIRCNAALHHPPKKAQGKK
jgi:hypothetical protein